MPRRETDFSRRSRERSQNRSHSPEWARGSSRHPEKGYARLLHCGCTGLMSHALPNPKEALQAQALNLTPADSLCGTPGKLLTERAGSQGTGTPVLIAETVSLLASQQSTHWKQKAWPLPRMMIYFFCAMHYFLQSRALHIESHHLNPSKPCVIELHHV